MAQADEAQRRLAEKRRRADAARGPSAGPAAAQRASAAAERLKARQEKAGVMSKDEAAARRKVGDRVVDAALRGDPPSLMTQAKHAFSAVPRGLLAMGGAAVTDVKHTVLPFTAPGRRGGEDFVEYMARTRPLTGGVIQSATRTADKLSEVAAVPFGKSGWQDTTYARESKEGRILASVLEDIANVSIAGAGVGRAAGGVAANTTGRTAQAAARVQKGAGNLTRLTGDVASMPAKPFIYGARAGAQVAKASGVGPAIARIPVTAGMTERMVKSNRIPATLVTGSRATVGQIATERIKQARQARQYRREALDPFGAETLTGIRRMEKLTERADKLLPDSDAQKAMLLVRSGQGDTVRVARRLEGKARDDFVREVWGVEHAPSQRTLDYALGYIDDTLPPKVRQPMDQAYPLLQKIQQMHEEMRLAGEGGRPLNPEQLGDTPMESAIVSDPELARLTEQASRTERLLEGDKAKGVPGLRDRAATQRARVGDPDLEAAIPRQAVGRVQKAAGTEAEAAILRQGAARQQGGAAAADQQAAALRERPFPTADPRILRGVERQAVRTDKATSAQRAASVEARTARGEIGQKVSAEERRIVAAERAERKAEAERTADDFQGEYDRITGGGERLHRPPARKRVGTDPITRKPIYARGGGGEWDWWDQLPRSEQARLVRNGWVARERGIVPDEMADFVARATDDEAMGGGMRMQGGVSEAMERWVDLTRRIDDARQTARTGGVSRAEAFEKLRERGPGSTFDEPGYDLAKWESDYDTVVNVLRTEPKGSPAWNDASRLYRDIVPEGLHEAAAGRSFAEAFEVARDLAAEKGARRFTPEGRLSAAEQKVAAAVEAKSPRGLTAPERKLFTAVQSALKGKAADTKLSAVRARTVDRIVAQVGPRIRKQGEQIGKAEGRAATLRGEASLAEFMAQTRERRLAGVDPQADLVAGMGVARKRLAPQIRREERATLEERRVAVIEKRLERLRTKAEARENWLREGHVDPVKRRDAVPGRYATPLLVASTAKRALGQMADELDAASDGAAGLYLRQMADDLPQTMADLQKRLGEKGLDLDYIIGGPVERLGGGARIPGGATTPVERRLSSSRQKREGRIPGSFKGAARLYAEELSQAVQNKAAAFVEKEYAKSPRDVLVAAGHAADDVDQLVKRGGEDLAKAMEREGWTAWSRTGRPPGMDAHAESTIYMPSPLEQQYRRYFKPALGGRGDTSGIGTVARIIDAPTRTWKHLVLAMNPMWNIGNAVSSLLLTTAAGGLTPRELVRYGREAQKALRRESDTGNLELPARLHGAGQAGEMMRGLRDPQREWSVLPERIGGRTKPGGGRQVPEAIRHPIQASYKLNQFVDDWGRSTVYLAKKGKGLNDEQAVRLALRAMGDFANMTAFERDYVRRVLPFYAWSRHVTQLAAHLAVEHPVRVAWMMHLGANYGGGADDAVSGLPSFLAGALRVGDGKFVSLRSLNPYGDVASLPFASAKELARGTNPVLKLAAFSQGFNLGKWRPVTRPPGSGRRSEYGGEELSPADAGALLYWLSQQAAPFRAAHATVSDPVVRYDTGDPMRLKGREIPLEGGRKEAILRNSGVPFIPTTFDEERQRARVAAVRRRDERSRRRYEAGR